MLLDVIIQAFHKMQMKRGKEIERVRMKQRRAREIQKIVQEVIERGLTISI
jgi:hypothetical protein